MCDSTKQMASLILNRLKFRIYGDAWCFKLMAYCFTSCLRDLSNVDIYSTGQKSRPLSNLTKPIDEMRNCLLYRTL